MQRGHEIAVARFASAAGKVEIEISAQVQAVPFYKSLGYELRSCEVYLDAGIAHQDMYWRGEK
ncbi:GNAT family N-acetyltransferase [Arcanobacterium hippocoleae]